MRLNKEEIEHIILQTIPTIFDKHWIELKDQIAHFIDKLHDREYGRILINRFEDPEVKAWLPKSDTFDVEASGRPFKFYSLSIAPEDFNRQWPDAGRRAVWWVSQSLPSTVSLPYPYDKGAVLNIKTPGHYASAVGLRLAVIALLDEESAFRLKFREFLSRDMIARENLEQRINQWIEDNVR